MWQWRWHGRRQQQQRSIDTTTVAAKLDTIRPPGRCNLDAAYQVYLCLQQHESSPSLHISQALHPRRVAAHASFHTCAPRTSSSHYDISLIDSPGITHAWLHRPSCVQACSLPALLGVMFLSLFH